MKLIEISKEDIGKHFTTISCVKNNFEIFEDFTSIIEEGQMLEREVFLNNKTWYLMKAIPYFTESKIIDGITITFTNINQFKNAQIQLQKNEERLRFIMDTVNDGYWDWEVDSNKEYLSPKFKEMFGYEDHELENSPETWQRLINPDDLELAIENATKHIESKGKYPYIQEVRYAHKDGSTVWVICRGAGIKDSEGRINRIIGTHTDITELKRTQEKLEQSNLELQRFAHIVSHDLQAPLRHIQSYLELFEENYKEKVDEKCKSWINNISSAAERMHYQIRSLLDFAKIGKQEINLSEFDLNESIGTVLKILDSDLSKINAKVQVTGSLKIYANQIYIEKALQNFIENAIKFRDLERVLELELVLSSNNGNSLISIEDNGIGIEEEYLDKIFDNFTRLSTANESEGSGIGLSICKKVIDYHKGKITVESKLGKGTKFLLSIPEKK